MANVKSETATDPAGKSVRTNGANGDGQTVKPSFDAGLDVLKAWQAFMLAGVELIADNAKATVADIEALSACRTAEEFGKANAAFEQSFTKRWRDSGQKLAALSGAFASDGIRASAKLTSSAFDQHPKN